MATQPEADDATPTIYQKKTKKNPSRYNPIQISPNPQRKSKTRVLFLIRRVGAKIPCEDPFTSLSSPVFFFLFFLSRSKLFIWGKKKKCAEKRRCETRTPPFFMTLGHAAKVNKQISKKVQNKVAKAKTKQNKTNFQTPLFLCSILYKITILHQKSYPMKERGNTVFGEKIETNFRF